MAQAKPTQNSTLTATAVKGPLPQPAISAAARHEGTKITLFFLAIENFSNRLPPLTFISDCVLEIRRRLKELSNSDANLFHEVRQFISGMPLDTIASSAHPKKLKHLLLESLLNPELLSSESLQTEMIVKKVSSLDDIIRDLQFYSKLLELCTNPHHGREILTAISTGIRTLKSDDRLELLKIIDKLSFYHPTDRAFLTRKLNESSIISLRPEQMIAVQKSAKLQSPPQDYALKSLLIFRRYKSVCQEIVAQAGETLESIQNRALRQQREYQQLIAELKSISSDDREKIHHYAGHHWEKFATSNPRSGREMNDFLHLLANPR